MKRIVRATAVAFAVGSAVLLSACGQVNVAATVDGATITEADLSSAVQQINDGYELTAPLTAQATLTMLIAAPTVLDYAASQGTTVTETQVRATTPVTNPSASTIETIRFNEVWTGLSDSQKVEASQRLAELKVTINPKYGTYDPTSLNVVPLQPNWLTTPGADEANNPTPSPAAS